MLASAAFIRAISQNGKLYITPYIFLFNIPKSVRPPWSAHVPARYVILEYA